MIMIIRRRPINDFLWYNHIKLRDLIKGISDFMTDNISLYTITEEEVIYYTPGHSLTQNYRLHPQRGSTRVITSYLLLPI